MSKENPGLSSSDRKVLITNFWKKLDSKERREMINSFKANKVINFLYSDFKIVFCFKGIRNYILQLMFFFIKTSYLA